MQRVFPITWTTEDTWQLEKQDWYPQADSILCGKLSRKPRAGSVWRYSWNVLSTDALGLDILYSHCEAEKEWGCGTRLPLANQRSLKVLSRVDVTTNFNAGVDTRSSPPHVLGAKAQWLGQDCGYRHLQEIYGSASLFFFCKELSVLIKCNPQTIAGSGNYPAYCSRGHWRWIGT